MHKFSGGNQQKAVIARWLRMKPKVLILDDPSQGVDMESKNILYDLILKATKKASILPVAPNIKANTTSLTSPKILDKNVKNEKTKLDFSKLFNFLLFKYNS